MNVKVGDIGHTEHILLHPLPARLDFTAENLIFFGTG